MAYLNEYMGDFLFDTFQPFHFYCGTAFGSSLVDYCLPSKQSTASVSKSRDAILEHIEKLPLVNSPEVFGLHSNAEIGYLTSAVREIWTHLVSMQPRTGATGKGISREEFIASLASDVLARLPVLFDIGRIYKSYGTPTPCQIVLLQELERFNILVERMQQSLKVLYSTNPTASS